MQINTFFEIVYKSTDEYFGEQNLSCNTLYIKTVDIKTKNISGNDITE